MARRAFCLAVESTAMSSPLAAILAGGRGEQFFTPDKEIDS
ncbi:MAG: hypothetical protein KatS3mg111_1112 [Pirellulaceae bacterium]|nr:MAG: hypothetical protein KatS3mg111_1112 [Pirellulaceae bacterium]